MNESESRREDDVPLTGSATDSAAPMRLAKAVGVAASTVQSIWKAHGLAPHRWRSFKLSNDPAFAEKLRPIIAGAASRSAMPVA